MRAEVGGMFAALANVGLCECDDHHRGAGCRPGRRNADGGGGADSHHPGRGDIGENTEPGLPMGAFPRRRSANALGELIEAGSVAVGDAMAGVLATQTWFRMAWYPSEVTLLAAVAGHDAPGLQTAVGHALAALFQSGQLDVGDRNAYT